MKLKKQRHHLSLLFGRPDVAAFKLVPESLLVIDPPVAHGLGGWEVCLPASHRSNTFDRWGLANSLQPGELRLADASDGCIPIARTDGSDASRDPLYIRLTLRCLRIRVENTRPKRPERCYLLGGRTSPANPEGQSTLSRGRVLGA